MAENTGFRVSRPSKRGVCVRFNVRHNNEIDVRTTHPEQALNSSELSMLLTLLVYVRFQGTGPTSGRAVRARLECGHRSCTCTTRLLLPPKYAILNQYKYIADNCVIYKAENASWTDISSEAKPFGNCGYVTTVSESIRLAC